MKIRIKELRNVRVGDLVANEKNFRTHSPTQRRLLSAMMDSIGFANAPIAYETEGGIKLIDGHLRTDTLDPDATIPVQILDVNDEEAAQLLATIDPLSALATTDGEALDSLLAEIELPIDILDLFPEPEEIVDDAPAGEPSEEADIPELYQITVELADEQDQVALYKKLSALGYQCTMQTS